MSGLQNALDGKRALVVGGAGGGIGRAITRGLAAAGASVAVSDVNPERAAEAVTEVRALGRLAVSLAGDVRSREAVEAMVTGAVEGLGGRDVLVTVVGGFVAFASSARVHETSDENWDLIFELNLRYVPRVLRAALRVFLEQGHGGSIVSVGSVVSATGSPMAAAYGAAKAGLASIARSVAAEYGGEGIRMNVVAGGAIATPVAAGAGADALNDWIPLRRLGESTEIANAVVFLASPLASYITGQSLVIDGGVTVRDPFP